MANVEFAYCLSGQVHPICKSYLVDNSEALTKGDIVTLNSDGHVIVHAGSGAIVLGSVGAVVDTNGGPVDMDSGSTDTWTVESDNETVDKKEALVNVDPTSCYEIDFDADIGTTGNSVVGGRFDLVDQDTVDESTATAGAANVALVATTDTATRGIITIVERQLI